jgi:pyruvate dehydrogenase E2 component (dihydrolipoamide acetyltransferase)
MTWLKAANDQRPVTERLLPVVIFIKAVARACTEVPVVNGFWTGHGFVPGPGVHVGCAIALRGGGLVAPALHAVPQKSLARLAREFADLVKRARAGTLRSSEMGDATITLTNLGDLGVESAYAIIYPPQVAIVAIGRVVERPWVVDGRVEPRTVITVSVSADHRAVDGRGAGAFLAAIERALQAPEAL